MTSETAASHIRASRRKDGFIPVVISKKELVTADMIGVQEAVAGTMGGCRHCMLGR